MRTLIKYFNTAETLQDFIKKSSFTQDEARHHLELAEKLNRKYLCIVVGEDGSEVLFSFSYRNRLVNIIKYFCGGEYDDNKIKTIHFFDTTTIEEDDDD